MVKNRSRDHVPLYLSDLTVRKRIRFLYHRWGGIKSGVYPDNTPSFYYIDYLYIDNPRVGFLWYNNIHDDIPPVS